MHECSSRRPQPSLDPTLRRGRTLLWGGRGAPTFPYDQSYLCRLHQPPLCQPQGAAGRDTLLSPFFLDSVSCIADSKFLENLCPSSAGVSPLDAPLPVLKEQQNIGELLLGRTGPRAPRCEAPLLPSAVPGKILPSLPSPQLTRSQRHSLSPAALEPGLYNGSQWLL